MPKEKQSHLVSAKDTERIRCSCCGAPSYICLYSKWDNGNRSGISFFYYCKAHRKGMLRGKPIPV